VTWRSSDQATDQGRTQFPLCLVERRRHNSLRQLIYSGPSPKRAIRPPGATPAILPAWECTRDGVGLWPPTAPCSTIALRATWTASPGIRLQTNLVEQGQQKWVGNDVPDFKVDSKPKITWPIHYECGGCRPNLGPLAAFADGPFPNTMNRPRALSTIRCTRSRLTIRWSNDSKPRTIIPTPKDGTRLSARPTA